MEFVVEHDLGSARAVLLGRQQKYGEAVKQYLDEDQTSDALDLTLEHIDDVMRDVDAFDAIVEKCLWRYLSFGCRGWPESASITVDKIDALLRWSPGLDVDDRDKGKVCGPYSFSTREAADPFGAALPFQNHILFLPGREVDERP